MNPRQTAIRNIMKPAYDGYVPLPQENVYNPPDVFNPALHVPEGEFDYLAVVENGLEYPELVVFDNSPLPPNKIERNNKLIPIGIDGVKPGIGWSVDSNANPDECDGSFDGFCNRGADQDCLLYGHNDRRSGMQFDSYSGWGVFTVPNVKLGVIIVRLEWWHGASNTRTEGWESENNGDETYSRRLTVANSTGVKSTRRLGEPEHELNQMVRQLKGTELCNDLKFDFAVNGKITTYNKEEFMDKLQIFQRVVQVQTILNDDSVTNGEPHDIEIALRLRDCKRGNMFKLSHIYWA